MSDVKQRLQRGDTVVAVNVAGANPDLMESLQRFGADLAFVDCERTGIGIDTATQLIRAARGCGLASVVRSPSDDPATLVQFLDRKAGGLVVPHVDTPAQAVAVVELTRYACGDDAVNRLVIVQVETRKAVECIDELAQVEGIDAFLLGPNDLAYDLTGKRGARTAETEQALDHVCARLTAAGRRFGMPSRIDELPAFRRRGCTLLYYPVEWLIERSLAELKTALR
jgi:2-keto-3-deoxy-L-rhamnonate aldolase RhmA